MDAALARRRQPAGVAALRQWVALAWATWTAPLWIWWRERRRRIRMARATARLEAWGVSPRVRAVKEALRTVAFAERFEAARALAEATTPLPDLHAVRALTLGVLGELGVDYRDVNVQFAWDPGHRELSIYASESYQASAAALGIEKREAHGWRR